MFHCLITVAKYIYIYMYIYIYLLCEYIDLDNNKKIKYILDTPNEFHHSLFVPMQLKYLSKVSNSFILSDKWGG